VDRSSLLVVEDSEFFGMYLLELASGSRGIAVSRLASTLAEARDALARSTPDVVLLDLGLPDGFGLDLIPEILSTNPEAVVIVVTADATPEARELARDAGAAAFVDKSHELGRIRPLLDSLFEPRARNAS
jgi:two-component system NtrC family response regulator